jgi:glucokinase
MRTAGAVDIGGTKILAGIADESGKILVSRSFPTITGEGGALGSTVAIADTLRQQCASIGLAFDALAGIGIVCAGPVSPVSGVVDNPYTLPGWGGFPIAANLKRMTGLRVKLENDANGVLLGEIKLLGLKDERVLMLTFGTGIGVAICHHGELYRANGIYHPEMGHMIVDSEGPACYCNHTGCFESLWSGAAINRRAMEMGYADFDQLYQGWKSGDTALAAFMRRAERQFANGVWNLVSIVKPDTLILGGGLMSRYFDFAAEIIRRDLAGLTDFVEEYRILKAGEQGESALVGGAALIFDE